MSVKVSKLPNGLTIASDSMETVESVSVGVWVDAGSRDETPELNGISHMLEHMAFKGTEKRTAQDIAEEIEAVGGQLNAYTSREQTAYYVKVLKEDTELGIDIISDILQNPSFAEEELEKERMVVLQEINQSIDTPDDIIFDYFQAACYPNQAIGRPILGNADTVASFSSQHLRDFMAQNYGANRMILAAAGRITHDELYALGEKYFASLPTCSASNRPASLYRGGEFREERDIEQVQIVLGFAGVSYNDPAYYTSLIYGTLLGGGMSSRLFQEIREKRGLVYSIYAYPSACGDSGVFAVAAGTGEDEAAEILPLILDEIRKTTEDINDAEIKRARAQIKAGLLMSLESTASRCEQLARHLQVYGRPLSIPEVVEKIEKVDKATIEAFAARMLETPTVLASLGPISKVPLKELL